MLYLRKDVEKLFSDLVVKYINDGARIDFNTSHYSCRNHDININLILPNNHRLVIYKTMDKQDDPCIFSDCGACTFGVMEFYNPIKYDSRFRYLHNEYINTELFTLYHFKNVYTDNVDEYNAMKTKATDRFYNACRFDKGYDRVRYNPDVIIKLFKRRKGYKRLKATDIIRVEKVYKYRDKMYFIIYVKDKPVIRVYGRKP